jgi:hypothetical protein
LFYMATKRGANLWGAPRLAIYFVNLKSAV